MQADAALRADEVIRTDSLRTGGAGVHGDSVVSSESSTGGCSAGGRVAPVSGMLVWSSAGATFGGADLGIETGTGGGAGAGGAATLSPTSDKAITPRQPRIPSTPSTPTI